MSYFSQMLTGEIVMPVAKKQKRISEKQQRAKPSAELARQRVENAAITRRENALNRYKKAIIALGKNAKAASIAAHIGVCRGSVDRMLKRYKEEGHIGVSETPSEGSYPCFVYYVIGAK